ncbi:MAG TPA: FMN-binding negative transcriptional regulator [Gemmatimonadales bacterium]|jgi:transcriptional regulator
MYVPPRFRIDDTAIDGFLKENGFATLVSGGGAELMATHIPVEVARGDGGTRIFTGHLSKANPQWRQLQETPDALLIFLGPHAYISPTWYDQPNVPTWNYQAVHVTGSVRMLPAGEELTDAVRELAERYEPPSQPAPRFDLDAMPAEVRAAELKGIVGFELRATRVEASFKLSQNRDEADYARIIRELEARGDDASREVAKAMRLLRPGVAPAP